MRYINIFWFKRDLRLADNEALHAAVLGEKPLLLLYIIEPSLEADSHYSTRHFDFIKESLSDLNRGLEGHGTRILAVRGEVPEVLASISGIFAVHQMFSTMETGLLKTFDRDRRVQAFCKRAGIGWVELSQNGVERGKHNRENWRENLNAFLTRPIKDTSVASAHFLPNSDLSKVDSLFDQVDLITTGGDFQPGGREAAMDCARSFFSERIRHYSDYISKPEDSRYGCSRLSPYIAWGNISVREVYQMAMELKKQKQHLRQLKAFTSRLKWQSHFIQKFESETRMEIEPVNRGYLAMPQPVNVGYIKAWKAGMTGYPLVDASMRAVAKTGYINFRMRALVTSFLTHHLFQSFTTGAPWLAQQFLDFEPGIHYGQMQMQAGLTGINTIRVYNPVKNAQEHDPEAIFIKKYLPELAGLPTSLALEPWKMTPMEEVMYDFNYGIDYPTRIVDITATRRVALDKLYGQRKTPFAKAEIARILDRHTLHRTESRFP